MHPAETHSTLNQNDWILSPLKALLPPNDTVLRVQHMLFSRAWTERSRLGPSDLVVGLCALEKLHQHVQSVSWSIFGDHVTGSLDGQKCQGNSPCLVGFKIPSHLSITALPRGPFPVLWQLESLVDPSAIAHVTQNVIRIPVVNQNVQIALLRPFLVILELGFVVEIVVDVPTIRPMTIWYGVGSYVNGGLYLGRIQIPFREIVDARGKDGRNGRP